MTHFITEPIVKWSSLSVYLWQTNLLVVFQHFCEFLNKHHLEWASNENWIGFFEFNELKNNKYKRITGKRAISLYKAQLIPLFSLSTIHFVKYVDWSKYIHPPTVNEAAKWGINKITEQEPIEWVLRREKESTYWCFVLCVNISFFRLCNWLSQLCLIRSQFEPSNSFIGNYKWNESWPSQFICRHLRQFLTVSG